MPVDIQRIQAVCFDLDGTLSDTDDIYVAALSRWLVPLRVLFPGAQPERVARLIVMGLETPGNLILKWLDRLHLDSAWRQLQQRSRRGRPVDRSHFRLIPGARDTVQQLFSRYPLAIASTRDGASARAILQHFELLEHFQSIVTAETTRYSKPHPEPLLLVAEQLGVPPESLLMVGDTSVDILAGKAVGAQTIGVLCGFGTHRELHEAGADLVIPSPADIPVVLSGKSVINK
jgi:HAD superfamily hydrolase (TIGR01509 family)